MKIAVTDANGYIGAHLVKKCLDFGHSVVAVDLANEYIDKRAEYINADIFNDENLYQKFGSPDVLIHLAWKNGFIHNAPSHLEDLYAHYKFVTDMIDNNIKNVSVLGTMHEVGYHVGAIDENTPCNPLSLYGISKNALRQSLMYYVSNKEVNFHWLRGFYIIGDDMRSNSIFGKIMRKVKAGEKTFPLNSGKIKYDFISLDDLCTQILTTSVQGEVNGIINMCSGNPVPLGERVEQFISDNNLDISLEYNVFSRQTDWLRGLAIVGIVYSHYFTMLKVNSSFLWLIGFLGVFGVAIFLFLSGYAAMMSYLKKPNYMKNYIPKRLVRLYVPFLIAYLCCDIVLLLSGHSFSVSDFTGAFILSLPNTLNWYLKVQLGFYLIFYVFAKIFRNPQKVIVSIYVCCFVYMVIGVITKIDNFWYESCYMFPVGMAFGLYKNDIFNFINKKFSLKFVLSIIIFVVSVIPVYFYGGVFAEILFVIGFMQFLFVACVRFRGNSCIASFLGTLSLEIYLAHAIAPNIVKLFYKGEINIISFIVTLLVAFLLAFAISKVSKLISNKILNRKKSA